MSMYAMGSLETGAIISVLMGGAAWYDCELTYGDLSTLEQFYKAKIVIIYCKNK